MQHTFKNSSLYISPVLTLIPGLNTTVISAGGSIKDGVDPGSGENFITELSDEAAFGWVLLNIGTTVSILVLVIYIVKAAYWKIKNFLKGMY